MGHLLLFSLTLLLLIRFSFGGCNWEHSQPIIAKWWTRERDVISCGNNYFCSGVMWNTIVDFLKSNGNNRVCLIVRNSYTTVSSLNYYSLIGVNLDSSFITFFKTDAFKGASYLEELSARSNSITTLPGNLFTSNNQLKIVDLSDNMINFIENGTFSNSIEYLNLRHNSLQKLDFHLPNSLINLEISFNKISYILGTTFHNKPQLRVLKLNNNVLTTLSPVLFILNNNITQFDLSYNFLSILNGDTFERLNKLKRLNLRNNTLTSLNFTLPASVVELDISFNSLLSIDENSFSAMTQLKTTTLRNNLLRSLPKKIFALNHNMNCLDLGANRLEVINFTLPQAIVTLDFSYNLISRIENNSFYELSKLAELRLNNNLLRGLPAGCFYHLNGLTFLDLSNNNIVLSYGTFGGLANLTELRLANNSITDLPELVLGTLQNLVTLDVSYNNLSTLDVMDITKHLNHLRSIQLKENQFKCSYLMEVIAQLKNKGLQVEGGQNFFENNVHGIKCIHDTQESSNANPSEENQESVSRGSAELNQDLNEITSKVQEKWSNKIDKLESILEEINRNVWSSNISVTALKQILENNQKDAREIKQFLKEFTAQIRESWSNKNETLERVLEEVNANSVWSSNASIAILKQILENNEQVTKQFLKENAELQENSSNKSKELEDISANIEKGVRENGNRDDKTFASQLLSGQPNISIKLNEVDRKIEGILKSNTNIVQTIVLVGMFIIMCLSLFILYRMYGKTKRGFSLTEMSNLTMQE